MQIFRPYQNHTETAKFLDYKRLNKQIVEAYQISLTCLAQLEVIDCKIGWRNHPVVKFIYNSGKPYLPDLYNYITELNKEWIVRGYRRGQDFQDKLDQLGNLIQKNAELFDWDLLLPFYCGDGKIDNTDAAWDMYKELLYKKWAIK